MTEQDQKENYRSKGVRHKSGKVFKGCIRDATTKMQIGSIPTTYQSIIYKNTQQTGFGTSQSRFEKSTMSISTNYQTDRKISVTDQSENICKDHNRLGLGAFISKVERLKKKKIGTPGPGQYSISIFGKRKKKNVKGPVWNSINYNSSINKQEHQIPGPGQYNITKQHPFQNKISGCKSSFITGVDRYGYIHKITSPGPCHYHKSVQNNHKNQLNELKQLKNQYQTQLKKRQDNIDTVLKKMMKKDVAQADIPGPTTYNQNIPEFKSFYERIKVSKNFAPSTKDRFGNHQDIQNMVAENNDFPSPFAYNIKSAFNQEKKLIGSPFFLSQSKRIPFEVDKQKIGPNVKTFQKDAKKQFHFNIKQQWL